MSIPYEDLAPQDQIARIAWEQGLEFDDALDVWCERHPGEPEPPRRARRTDGLCPFGCGWPAPKPGQLHMCPNLTDGPPR